MRLNSDDGQAFRPPLFAEAGRGDPVYCGLRNLPHPIGIANNAWGRVETTLKTLLDELDVSYRTPGAAGASRPELLEAHRAYVYANAEFAEAVIERIPSCYVAAGEKLPRAEGTKKLRHHADIICNKLKHDQNRLVAVSAETPLCRVLGYTVFGVNSEGILRPNPEVHRGREAFSFATDVRIILANSYLIGAAVGQLIASLDAPKRETRPPDVSQIKRTTTLLMRVIELPTAIFPWEKRADMPSFDFDERELRISKSGGSVLLYPGSYKICVFYTGDGVTRQFALPHARR